MDYIPQVGDQFTIRWKQHFDRSYINTIWRAVGVDGDTVVGVSEVGDYRQMRKIVFRTFDVTFSQVCFKEDKAHQFAAAGVLYEAMYALYDSGYFIESVVDTEHDLQLKRDARSALAKAEGEVE